jgi:inhibitor of cysteine peptidase
MDEFNDYLRIATTSGNWGESLVNQVYVLDSNLETVGLLKDIAKGERIKSVRFTGNTAYVVTFIQTDPLFVIDLTDVKVPKILGELKIPGYSAYLHPVGEGLVMGVGLDGTETGINGGMKVSLFDVSDPTKPVECGKFTMSGYDSDNRQVYVDSDAFYDHKALCWDKEEKVMYIPYRKDSRVWASQNGEELAYNSITGIIAVKVDEEGKMLSAAGDYITEATENALPNEITRTTYINNTIYGYSSYDGFLSSFDKATQKQLYILDVCM